MNNKKILLVEDEKLAREGVRDFLISRGYLVTEAVDGEEAVKKFCESGQSVFDLVILDVMLPKMNGILVLKEIRKRSKIPVLMLTALSDEGTQLASFDNLADDYLCKPFSLLILEKRIEALLRRALENPQKEGVSKWVREGVLVDFLEYKGYLNGVDVDLKPKEVELLKFLIENPKVTLRREQILEELWKDELPYDRVIDVYIKNLRKKLQIDCIKNRKGLKKIYLRIFPKTFLSMSLILGVLILLVHSLVYVLMNQAYADEKKEKAKRNLNELSEQITGKSAEEIRRICGEFALQKNVNLNLKIDGKVQHLQGFSGADIVTDELLPSDLVPLVNNEQLGSILVSDLTAVDADGKTILVQMLSNVESLKEAREATLKILPF